MKKLLVTGLVVAVAAGAWVWRTRGAALTLPSADVTLGEFVDIVELRGDVKPFKSVLVSAPMMSGDVQMQILKIASNGLAVKTGDVVIEFDGTSLQRTIQEKQSELKQAQEELRQAKAQASIGAESDRTALLHAQFDVDRAKLGMGDETILSKIEAEKNKLALADAEQRLNEAEVKDSANRKAAEHGHAAQTNKIAKVTADLEKAQKALESLKVKSPGDGVVRVMSNFRMSMMSGQEFRAGDRVWAGAQLIELPDLSSVHLTARLDESDRGVLQTGQTATIRLDAIPDRDYHATVTDVSLLARVDYSNWPPTKQFDLKLTFTDADARLRPGMSAAARIAVGRLPGVMLVPAEAVFLVDGRAMVYRLSPDKRTVTPLEVEVLKRNTQQAALKGALRPGDLVTLVRPDAAAKGTKKS